MFFTKRFYTLLLSYFSTLLLASCVVSSGNPDVTSVNNGSDAGGETDGTNPMLWNEFQAVFEGKTPDGKPVDLVYFCSASCIDETNGKLFENQIREKKENVFEFQFKKNFQINKEGSYTILLERSGYLFAQQTFNTGFTKPKAQTIEKHTLSWGEGSWGIAPNGIYLDSRTGKQKEVTTSVKNGKVTLTIPLASPNVTGTVLTDENDGEKVDGEIQENGKKILYKIFFKKIQETNEGILTLVKN